MSTQGVVKEDTSRLGADVRHFPQHFQVSEAKQN